MPDQASKVSVLRCTTCGRLDPGPRELCTSCQAGPLDAAEVPATGILVSWTMIRRPPTAFRDEGEYAVAVVALNAGVQITGRLTFAGDGPPPGIWVVAAETNGDVPVFQVAP